MDSNLTPQDNPNIDRSGWRNEYWYSYNDFLSKRFGERIYKVTVNAGFTCPTRDGSKGTKGCSFCDEHGSASYHSARQVSVNIKDQLEKNIPFVKRRFGAKKYLAYFQSFTNTYAPVSYLKEVYDAALNHPEVSGMAVGTRPDCLSHAVLDLLHTYSKDYFVSLELGQQSFRDDTLKFYERGHSVKEGVEGIARAMKYKGFHVGVHLMFGPGETEKDAIHAARMINSLGVHSVKVHQLMVLKNTLLADAFKKNPWHLPSLHEYNDMVIAFLEHLNPTVQVERTHALTTHPEELVGPEWSQLRFEPLQYLKKAMQINGSYQGKKAFLN